MMRTRQANFSTGPVAISARVHSAFAACAISHRSTEFLRLLDETRAMLCALTNAKHVAIACGSGTLANEIVAQQIKALPTHSKHAKHVPHGLILVSGEFGERLCGLATRAGLSFETLRVPWGTRLHMRDIQEKISATHYDWLWSTATETSTGACVDLNALQEITRDHGIALCLDCMSAIGMTTLDLSDVHLASASSGKALGSIAGLAIVFAKTRPEPRDDIAATLDLALHLRNGGVPFTIASSLICALHASLCEITPNAQARFERIAHDSQWLRSTLQGRDLPLLMNPSDASHSSHLANGIITVDIAKPTSAQHVGQTLRARGVEIGFESDYLRSRNWIQIALMGQYSRTALRYLPEQIARVIAND
jgi:aspartate aminotransferase-like enzyme